jgi:Double-GTPase 2
MRFFEPQPAHLVYAFDGGWRVMAYVRANVFSRTNAAARTWFTWGEQWAAKVKAQDNVVLKYWHGCLAAGCYLGGASHYVGAMALVSGFTLLQFVFLVMWASVAGLSMVLLAAFNIARSSYYRIFFRCPTCYAHMRIPIFVCPRCATDHSRLWPSVYGIFYHRCKGCNSGLPALDLLGRRKLIRKCVACARPLNKEVGQLINVHIPVIGGPSTGKSNFIFMATRELINSYAGPRGYSTEFPDEGDRVEYTRNLVELGSGRVLQKTPDITPQAYNLALKRPRERLGRIIYIYDAAGEAYSTEDNTVLQKYYDYVDGLIFVIDPMSIELYRRAHLKEVESLRNQLRPSALGVMEAYGRMITVLEASVGLRPGRKFRHPIAVLISKVDALDLEEKIGKTAAGRVMTEDPSLHLEEDAIHMLVQEFLQEHEMGNLVRDLYLQFEHVHFFSCSALGRMPENEAAGPFHPVRVLEPITWILGTLGVIDAVKERCRVIDSKDWAMARSKGLFGAVTSYYWNSLRPR